MVQVNNIEQFLAEIHTIPFFSNLGTPVNSSFSVGNTKVFPAATIEEALHLWHTPDFEEAQSVAWEACRQAISHERKLVPLWEDGFRRCQAAVSIALQGSLRAHELMKQTGEDIETFARKLPFLGAVGELLIQHIRPEWNFNLSQVPYYIGGFWVCGWRGELAEDRFVYPDRVFYIH